MKQSTLQNKVSCYHCGDICRDQRIEISGKFFCCNGCKMVYELLSENNLYSYYEINQTPGIKNQDKTATEKFAYLEDDEVKKKLLDFSDNGISRVTLFLPGIHCSSCIWLLEKLYRLSPAIKTSRVNFVKKQVMITFKDKEISLKELVELLTSIGYEPKIQMEDLDGKRGGDLNRTLYLKIAIAGFAFGNSMFFSFPDYLDSLQILSKEFKTFFSVLNIFLSVPVLVYCASDYFISSYKGLKKKILNIDVPISLGILALVIRSFYEIFSGTGLGYFDSFNGLVFFLLLGRLFQEKTYATLSFERDYKSYFPVSVLIIKNENEKVIAISDLQIGDQVLLRNQELIPADAILLSKSASIDYSFVTGESEPVEKKMDDTLYAGGRLNGASVKIKIIKKVSQSYLTKLWNNDVFHKEEPETLSDLSSRVAKYFTITILSIAFFSGIYWANAGFTAAINVISAILIVACPCALALSIPFTFGNTMRIFGRNKFYIKNIQIVERLKNITHIIFDKTGTLTLSQNPKINFNGSLNSKEKTLIKSLVKNSVHPLSRHIDSYLPESDILEVENFVEIGNQGIMGTIKNHSVMLGSSKWVGADPQQNKEKTSTVFVSINGRVLGDFNISNRYRTGLKEVLGELNKRGKIAIISGDNPSEKVYFKSLFKALKINGELYFNQSPYEKQNFILELQNSGRRTLMIGDGLNDAGALKQSDIGISISDDINTFSPACDAILDAAEFRQLPKFLKFARLSYYTVITSFFISFLYNIIGLGFAISGLLSPLIAAVLMPLSSISVVVFATIVTRTVARKIGL